MTRTALIVTLIAALAVGLGAQQAAMPFEEALAKTAAYETGADRAAIVELGRQVIVADAARAKAMEQAFIRALQGQATLEGKDQICRHLRLIGTAASVPVLASMLQNAETADMARYALERMPDPAVNGALRAALPKASGKVQAGIANTLGRRRDAQAVAALRKLIGSGDPVVASAAAAALGNIGGTSAAAALKTTRASASGAVRFEVDQAYLQCAEQLAEGGGKKAAFAMFKELTAASEPEMIRVGALRGLALSGGNDAVPVLTAAIKAPAPNVQAQAIRMLSTIPGAGVTSALVAAYAGADTLAKVRIASALGDRGDKAAIPALLSAAKDAAAPARIAALNALGKMADASLAAVLAGAAASAADAGEQAAAREALYRLRGEDTDRAIIAGVAGADSKVAAELIAAAGERGLKQANPALFSAAAGANGETRRAALRALRDTAQPGDVPVLLDLVAKTRGATDRAAAVRVLSSALRRSNAVSVAPVMAAYGASDDAGFRGALLTVLAQVGRDESLAVIRGALKDPNAELRRGAILALSEWPSAAPMPDLLAIAKSDPTPAFQILSLRGYIRLLGTADGRPPGETVRLLGEAMALAKQADEKRAVLALLQRIATKDSLAIAEAAMKDPEVASEAGTAAERIRQRLAPRRRE